MQKNVVMEEKKSLFEYFNGLQEKAANDLEAKQNREKQNANRENKIALFADLAKLGAQAFASAGGATKIEKSTPFSHYAQQRYNKMIEKHSKELNDLNKDNKTYANILLKHARLKQQQEQSDARLKQQQEQFDARLKQQQEQFDERFKQKQEQFDARLKQQQEQFDTKLNVPSKTTSKSETVYMYNEDKGTNVPVQNIYQAYARLPQNFKVPKVIITSTGSQLIVENPTPTKQQMEYMLELYNYHTSTGIPYDAFESVNTAKFARDGYTRLEGDEIDPEEIVTKPYITDADGTRHYRKVSK